MHVPQNLSRPGQPPVDAAKNGHAVRTKRLEPERLLLMTTANQRRQQQHQQQQRQQ